MSKKKKLTSKPGIDIPDFTEPNKYYHSAPANKIEKFIHNLIPDIVEAYGLGNINFFYQTVEKRNVEDFDSEKGSLLLSIMYVKPYKNAFINIMPPAQKMFNDGEVKFLARAVVHEIGHIITNELGELALNRFVTEEDVKDAVEETTESIAQIVRKVLEVKDPKNYKIN